VVRRVHPYRALRGRQTWKVDCDLWRQADLETVMARYECSTTLRRGESRSTGSKDRALCLVFEACGPRAVRAEGEMALWRRRVVQRACGRSGPVSKKPACIDRSRRDGMGIVDKGRYPVEPESGLPIHNGGCGSGGRRSKAYLRLLRGNEQVRYLHAKRSFLEFPERKIGDSHFSETMYVWSALS
jgi:hypothetical protein